MQRQLRRICFALLLSGVAGRPVLGQQALTWQEIVNRFETNNPELKAGQIGIEEAKAEEVTAYLRPNPTTTILADQVDPFTFQPFRPLAGFLPAVSVDYLHERRRKRELRRASAEAGTRISISDQVDLRRTLLFGLHDAFIRTLQSKAVLALAKENLTYYDKLLAVNRDRYRSGDIAQVDLNRLELQRIQFESDVVTAQVNLRTAKIQLLSAMNDRTPVDGFDINGNFDFGKELPALDDFRKIALEERPDLKAAMQSIEKARIDHQLAVANGSVDPTFGVDGGRNPPIDHYIGFSVNVPLRIFDRNQGEKLRTQLDIGRNERLRDAAEAGILRDVDSAYTALKSTLELLRPYQGKYLQQAASVRDTVSFAYGHGAASLLDFLDAQKSYRDTQLNYLNLVGAYLSAANQLNFSVGREVIQ